MRCSPQRLNIKRIFSALYDDAQCPSCIRPCSTSVHRSFPASSNFGRLCAIRPCIFGASSLTSLRRRRIPSGAYVKDSRGIACSTKSRIIERPGSRDSRAGNGERCELPQRRGRATRKSQLRDFHPLPTVVSSNRSPSWTRMRLTHSLTVNYDAASNGASIDGESLCESETPGCLPHLAFNNTADGRVCFPASDRKLRPLAATNAS